MDKIIFFKDEECEWSQKDNIERVSNLTKKIVVGMNKKDLDGMGLHLTGKGKLDNSSYSDHSVWIFHSIPGVDLFVKMQSECEWNQPDCWEQKATVKQVLRVSEGYASDSEREFWNHGNVVKPERSSSKVSGFFVKWLDYFLSFFK